MALQSGCASLSISPDSRCTVVGRRRLDAAEIVLAIRIIVRREGRE
jgi:hypothetical protein